jgi:hypothetical protein
MTIPIPAKLQIFQDGNVVLSDKDAERLAPFLGGWPKLNSFFLTSPTEPDLKRLLIMELMGDCREQMVDKLLARLGTVTQARWRKRITDAVDLVPSKRRKKKKGRK